MKPFRSKNVTRGTSDNPAGNVLVLACMDPRFTENLNFFLMNQKWANYHFTTCIGCCLGVNQSFIMNPFGDPINNGVNAGSINWPVNLVDNQGNGIVNSISPFFKHAVRWGPTFLENIALSAFANINNPKFKMFTEIWAFEHLDCDAYKNLIYTPRTQFLTSNDIVLQQNNVYLDRDANTHITMMQALKSLLATGDYKVGPGAGYSYVNPAVVEMNNGIIEYTGELTRSLIFKGFLISMDGTISLPVNDGTGIKIDLKSESLKKHNTLFLILGGVLALGLIFPIVAYLKSKPVSKTSNIY